MPSLVEIADLLLSTVNMAWTSTNQYRLAFQLDNIVTLPLDLKLGHLAQDQQLLLTRAALQTFTLVQVLLKDSLLFTLNRVCKKYHIILSNTC